MARIVRQYETVGGDGGPVLAFELDCGHALYFGTRMILLDSKRFMAAVDDMVANHRCLTAEAIIRRQTSAERAREVERTYARQREREMQSRISPAVTWERMWAWSPLTDDPVYNSSTLKKNPVGFDPKQLEPLTATEVRARQEERFQQLDQIVNRAQEALAVPPKLMEPEKPKPKEEWKKDRFELIELE